MTNGEKPKMTPELYELSFIVHYFILLLYFVKFCVTSGLPGKKKKSLIFEYYFKTKVVAFTACTRSSSEWKR